MQETNVLLPDVTTIPFTARATEVIEAKDLQVFDQALQFGRQGAANESQMPAIKDFHGCRVN